MTRTAQKDNNVERALRRAVYALGLRFRLHRRLIAGSRRSTDIVFPSSRVAVFVDGCFWHSCPLHGTKPKNNAEWWEAKLTANLTRDRDTDECLMRLGWKVVRVWEHEDPVIAATAIERVVRARLQRLKIRP